MSASPHSVLHEIEALRPVCLDPKQVDIALAEAGSLIEQLEACEADRNSLSKSADYLQEQFGVLQEKARRFLVATGGPPEKIEDVGKARRELVDALHASYPASSPRCGCPGECELPSVEDIQAIYTEAREAGDPGLQHAPVKGAK